MHRRSSFTVLCAIVLTCAFAAPAHAEEATVPDVVGLSLDRAKGLLDQAGFAARIENVPGTDVGRVVSQSPGGFATRDTSGAVTLTVVAPTPKPGPGTSPLDTAPTGPGTVDPMPGPTPTEPAPAQPAPAEPAPAAAAGALVWNGRAIPEGRMPGGGGPELPSVLGQRVERARGTLRRWQVRIEQTLAVPQLAGTIVNQWPPAGGGLPAGETVTLVVAVTKRPSDAHRYVPQAERKAWREALALVEKSGFVPRPVSVTSSAGDRGLVLAQSPQPGSMELGGQPIRLFVGRGPGAYSADTAAPDADTQPAPEPVKPTPTEPDAPPAGMGDTPLGPPPALPTPTPDRPTPSEPPAQPTPAQPTPTQPEVQPALGAPSLSKPPAGESYPYKYGADFSWTAVRGAATYDLELQEELPSGAWQTKSTTSVSGAKYRPAKLERGRYRWRVRAVTSDGGKGRWSEYRRLYMY